MPRRAYVTMYRPESMVQLERELDFDHGKAVCINTKALYLLSSLLYKLPLNLFVSGTGWSFGCIKVSSLIPGLILKKGNYRYT